MSFTTKTVFDDSFSSLSKLYITEKNILGYVGKDDFADENISIYGGGGKLYHGENLAGMKTGTKNNYNCSYISLFKIWLEAS